EADGNGLYVQIPEVSYTSLFRFQGTRHEAGLGSARIVGLNDARASNAEIRRKLAKGINPLDERTAERAKAKLDAAKAMIRRQCAEAYIKAHRAGWRSDKHAAQWVTTLETYVYPVMGELPVGAINTALIMKVLEQEVRDAPDEPATPLWTAKTETASRLRGRI